MQKDKLCPTDTEKGNSTADKNIYIVIIYTVAGGTQRYNLLLKYRTDRSVFVSLTDKHFIPEISRMLLDIYNFRVIVNRNLLHKFYVPPVTHLPHSEKVMGAASSDLGGP